MAARAFPLPTVWTREQLVVARTTSIEHFIAERRAADPAAWADQFAEVKVLVETVFEQTDNLLSISAGTLLEQPDVWWHVLRYCCGPPVSEEDLWTYVGGPKFKKVTSSWAEGTAQVFRDFVDDVRFPWVRESRGPSDFELARAIDATIMPLAQQRFATKGRGRASERQEAFVASTLAEANFKNEQSTSEITVLDQLKRGHFSRERKLAGDKCDVPLRLADGRILAIECKASNGPKNGWKRLVREVGGKAETWRTNFGTQVVTAAVVSGVYDLSCLERGQDRGVFLFWEHDLQPLLSFAASAT